MILRKNGMMAGIGLTLVCIVVFLIARSGVGRTVTCHLCGDIVQDYVEVSASPKSANIFNMSIMKDAAQQKGATVHYTLCNDCFEEIQGAIRWHRQQKRG